MASCRLAVDKTLLILHCITHLTFIFPYKTAFNSLGSVRFFLYIYFWKTSLMHLLLLLCNKAAFI